MAPPHQNKKLWRHWKKRHGYVRNETQYPRFSKTLHFSESGQGAERFVHNIRCCNLWLKMCRITFWITVYLDLFRKKLLLTWKMYGKVKLMTLFNIDKLNKHSYEFVWNKTKINIHYRNHQTIPTVAVLQFNSTFVFVFFCVDFTWLMGEFILALSSMELPSNLTET